MSVTGKLYFLEERVREVDPALFIEQRQDGLYLIKRHGRRRDWLIMSVPHLHPSILVDLRRMDGWSHGVRNYVHRLELAEYEEEQRREREEAEMRHELAKEAHRALMHDLGVA